MASKFFSLSNYPLNVNKSTDIFSKTWSCVNSCFLSTAETQRLTTPGWDLAAVLPACHLCPCKTLSLRPYLPHTKFCNNIDDVRCNYSVLSWGWRSWYVISLAGATTSIIFVATKHILCHDKSMLAATKLLSQEKHTKKKMSQQAHFCHDKRCVLLQQHVSWQK